MIFFKHYKAIFGGLFIIIGILISPFFASAEFFDEYINFTGWGFDNTGKLIVNYEALKDTGFHQPDSKIFILNNDFSERFEVSLSNQQYNIHIIPGTYSGFEFQYSNPSGVRLIICDNVWYFHGKVQGANYWDYIYKNDLLTDPDFAGWRACRNSKYGKILFDGYDYGKIGNYDRFYCWPAGCSYGGYYLNGNSEEKFFAGNGIQSYLNVFSPSNNFQSISGEILFSVESFLNGSGFFSFTIYDTNTGFKPVEITIPILGYYNFSTTTQLFNGDYIAFFSIMDGLPYKVFFLTKSINFSVNNSPFIPRFLWQGKTPEEYCGGTTTPCYTLGTSVYDFFSIFGGRISSIARNINSASGTANGIYFATTILTAKQYAQLMNTFFEGWPVMEIFTIYFVIFLVLVCYKIIYRIVKFIK